VGSEDEEEGEEEGFRLDKHMKLLPFLTVFSLW
jgi:hypothetical protein